MFIVYGSEMCPDCRGCKINFDANGVAYRFVDINKNLHDLAAFLKLRDTKPVFEKWKALGDIGIPAIVGEDGEVFTDWEGYLKERGLPIVYEDSAPACSISGKGC